MGITITQYRISIGYFNSCKFSLSGVNIGFSNLTINLIFLVLIILGVLTFLRNVEINELYCFLCISLYFNRTKLRTPMSVIKAVISNENMNDVYFHLITILVLKLGGDIESNPGPNSICKFLNICHVNIRSLSRSKLLAIEASLSVVYDVITISETHLHQGVKNDLFVLKGYHDIIRRDRGENGGGIAIFIKENISFKILYKLEKPNLEAMWISLNTIEGKVIICCCYRPPDISDFWVDFQNCLDEIKTNDVQNIFILGDLNADPATRNGRKLNDLCLRNNLYCLVNEPTRITQNTATILDQIITNCPNFVKSTTVSPPVSSNDHCTVGARLSFKIKKEKAYKRTIWNYKKGDFTLFRKQLLDANFAECFETNDVDKACSMWTNKFLDTAKLCIPNKIVTIRPNDSPWYTNELRKLKRYMMKLFNKFKKSKSITDWEKYSAARSEYKNGLDNASSMFKKSLTEKLSKNKNSKSWWSTVKWLLGKGGDISYPTLNVNGKQITDNQDKAESYNDFFLSHSNIDVSNASLPDDDNFESNLTEINATEEEVRDLIECIDTTKATGPDGISPKLLYEAGSVIVPSLTKLINLSLSTSKVPNDWKIANVIPLFKKGDKNERNNYRPVSLLSCVSKILERVVFKHLFNYLRGKLLISEHQSGFQPGDSTINQLAYLYHEFSKALDEKKDVHIIFCDISKAFDKVWHPALIYKLKKMGIGGILLLWFIDYLHDRHQRVIIRGQQSEKGLIKAGVPQGSVLGPLLFLIYINDITLVTQSKMKLFADDTSLYIEFDNAEEAAEILNDDLKDIQQWADQWLVTFSAPKTKLLTCSFKNKQYAPIKFNNVELKPVKNHKHLGLTFSSNLGWTAHIGSILQSVSSMSDVLKRLKYDLDRHTIEKTYFTFIRPKLEYASIIWDNCTQQDCDELENFQLEVARTVTGARRGTSHESIYMETNWQTLKERRLLNKLKMFSKMADGKGPHYLLSLLPEKVESRRPNSRYKDDYILPKCRTATFENSFIPSTAKAWNELPAASRNTDYMVLQLKHHKKSLYYEGKRSDNIKHAQLRMNCSKLNAHLFFLHVSDTKQCSCGHDTEDSTHFLLYCPLFYVQRQIMMQALKQYIDVSNINSDLLLYGDDSLTLSVNKGVFQAIHRYISDTDRL